MSTTRPDAVHGRKYRSKKNRPCDLCRKKRMACLREDNMTRCLPCELRKLDCTYVLEPVKKRKRSNETADEAPTAEKIRLDVYTTRPRHLTVSSNQLDQRPRTRNSLELHNGQTSLFVGFSGDQDPWLLSKLYRDHDAPEESDINYDLKKTPSTRVCLLPGHAQQDAVVDAARIHVYHLVAVPGESPAGCPQPEGRTDVLTVRFRAGSAVAGAGRCHAADYPGAAAQGELAAAADPQRQRSPPLGAVGITRSHGTGAGPEPRAARMGHPAVGGAHAAPALVDDLRLRQVGEFWAVAVVAHRRHGVQG
ncbi:hypothetical protein KL923_004866 [Ogataea haglerorum]|nr:hypothetical protein KL923_004866 [Ogataea haglerorum]